MGEGERGEKWLPRGKGDKIPINLLNFVILFNKPYKMGIRHLNSHWRGLIDWQDNNFKPHIICKKSRALRRAFNEVKSKITF